MHQNCFEAFAWMIVRTTVMAGEANGALPQISIFEKWLHMSVICFGKAEDTDGTTILKNWNIVADSSRWGIGTGDTRRLNKNNKTLGIPIDGIFGCRKLTYDCWITTSKLIEIIRNQLASCDDCLVRYSSLSIATADWLFQNHHCKLCSVVYDPTLLMEHRTPCTIKISDLITSIFYCESSSPIQVPPLACPWCC